MVLKTVVLLIAVLELGLGTQHEGAKQAQATGGVRREDAPPELRPHLDHLAKSLTEIFNRKLNRQDEIVKQKLRTQDERFAKLIKEKDEIIQSQRSQLDDVIMKLGLLMDNQKSILQSEETEQQSIVLQPTESESFIGFMATPSGNRTYELGDRIIFDDVYFDASKNYNPTNSVFTCPFDGFYNFAVVITTAEYAEGEWLRFDAFLVVGGRYHLKAITTSSVSQTTQGSVSSVYRCGAGEQVYVEAALAGEHGLLGPQHSAFSGHLVSKL